MRVVYEELVNQQRDKRFFGLQHKCIIIAASIEVPETIIAIEREDDSPNLVLGLNFRRSTVNYFPRGLHQSFRYLTRLHLIDCKLMVLDRLDLIALDRLISINFDKNYLRLLPSDLFVGMKGLKAISFAYNEMEFLSSELLNPVLENGLTFVNFRGNKRIDDFFKDNGESDLSLQELMEVIDEKCLDPDDSKDNDDAFIEKK